MRSPGRCTNHEACWLGNGQRTVDVAITDPFCCPICGGALAPPPLEAIARKGIRKAITMSAMLILAAGSTGFGLVKLIHSGADPDLAKRGVARMAPIKPPEQLKHGQPVSVASRMPAPDSSYAVPVAVARSAQVAVPVVPHAPASAMMAAAPPRVPEPDLALIDSRLLRSPLPQILVAQNVIQEPLRTAVLPISFGKPLPPEDDTPAKPRRWHYRAITTVVRRNEILPAPGGADIDNDTPMSPPIIPDTSWAAAVAPSERAIVPELATDTVPKDVEPAPPAVLKTSDAMTPAPPTLASSRPTFDPAPAIEMAQDRYTQPIPETAPAARVDPDIAAQLDRAPDAPVRLAALRPAPQDRLTLPAYPAIKAEIDQPGRVDVGCVISRHGLPFGCHVDWQLGGVDFAHSVMTWLSSGAVRYRPHILHGEPVPEDRLYHVRFEP